MYATYMTCQLWVRMKSEYFQRQVYKYLYEGMKEHLGIENILNG